MSVLKKSFEDLMAIKRNAEAKAQKELIIKNQNFLEEQSRSIFQSILNEGEEKEEAGEESPVDTTVAASDEFDIDSAPTVTTSTNPEDGALEIEIDTHKEVPTIDTPQTVTLPGAEGGEAPLDAINLEIPLPGAEGSAPTGEHECTCPVHGEAVADGLPGVGIPALLPGNPAADTEGGEEVENPFVSLENPEDKTLEESTDMTSANMDEIMETFLMMNEDDSFEVVSEEESNNPLKENTTDMTDGNAEETVKPLTEEEIAELTNNLDEAALLEALSSLSSNEDDEESDGGFGGEYTPDAETAAQMKSAVSGFKRKQKADVGFDDELDESTATEGEPTLDESGSRSLANGHHTNQKPADFPDSLKRAGLNEEQLAELNEQVSKLAVGYKQLQEQVSELTTQNVALASLNEGLENQVGQFRNKLFEASTLAMKTAYVNKLFLEHTTNKEQKVAIVESFSAAKTQAESGQLFENFSKSLKNGLLAEGKSGLSNLSTVFTTETEDKPSLNESVEIAPGVNANAARFNEILKHKMR